MGSAEGLPPTAAVFGRNGLSVRGGRVKGRLWSMGCIFIRMRPWEGSWCVPLVCQLPGDFMEEAPDGVDRGEGVTGGFLALNPRFNPRADSVGKGSGVEGIPLRVVQLAGC